MCRIYKLFTYAEKALRYVGEPFLYVLELANLNLDGIAGMRSGGGSVLKATGPFTYWGTDEGALPREREPARRLQGQANGFFPALPLEHRPCAGCAELARASASTLEPLDMNF